MLRTRFLKFACVISVSLMAAACANKSTIGGGSGSYAPGSSQEFSQAIGDRVFFELDSTDLNARAITTIDSQAQWLQANTKYRILLEGHADERGTREYNYSLGSRRAKSVRDYLVTRGISSNRIRSISYGKERPVAVCNDISCWSQNRRVVIVLE